MTTKQEFRSMMRYLAADDVFEYKADESSKETARIPSARIDDLRKGVEHENPAMAKLLNFLVENAKKDPGKWVEATTDSVANGQALL